MLLLQIEHCFFDFFKCNGSVKCGSQYRNCVSNGDPQCIGSLVCSGPPLAVCDTPKTYETRYALLIAAMEEPVQRPPLTEGDVTLLRTRLEELRQRALKSLQDPLQTWDPCICMHYLSLGFLWGCNDSHRPQRNDVRTYRFDGPDALPTHNRIKVADGKVTLTIVSANKVSLTTPVTLALHEQSPKLAEFLRAYQSRAVEFQNSNAPYVLCQRRNKQPLSATHLSTMQPRAFARLKLPFVAHGCNSARHYAVAAQRKKHGRKRLSEEELAEEEDRAKCMLHSRVTADATYG
eukprot:COSAG01_NODE_11547_length_1906_cov_2.798008_2_plen_291_part_00